MRLLRLLLQYIFVVANGAAFLLLVASAYSDRFSPESSLLFPYLGLGFPLFCLLNGAFLLYWLFTKSWKFLWISVAAFLLSGGAVARYLPWHSSREALPAEEERLKVLTYNVMAFGYKDHTKQAPNPILQYIANSGADIVCLQEYAESRKADGLTRRKIFSALKMYPYRSIIRTHSGRYTNFGIALFSKYPIRNSRRIRFDSRYNASSIHRVDLKKGKSLTVINNHLESFKLTMEDRSRYSAFIQNLGADGLDGLGGSFRQKIGTAFRIRAKQAETVAAEIDRVKSDYLLVCGDFNDTPISYARRTIQGQLSDAFAESGRGLGITYNQNYFWFRIDHILHSSEMKAFRCTVDKVSYSDHYPVWCYLQLL